MYLDFQMQLAIEEKCEFLPFLNPKRVIVNSNHITAMEFFRTEQDDDDNWIETPDQIVRLRVDFVIAAFGCSLLDDEGP